MGPPPAPPPPPVLKPTTTLSFGRRSTENARRRDNDPVSATSQPSRPRVDCETLQHAAASLRKTGYNKQIRGDFSDLSDGRLDRSYEQLPGQHWQNSEKQSKLDSNQTRKSVPASSSSSYQPCSYYNVHRDSNTINTGYHDGHHDISINRFSKTSLPSSSPNPGDNSFKPFLDNFGSNSFSQNAVYSSTPAHIINQNPQYNRFSISNNDNFSTVLQEHRPLLPPPQNHHPKIHVHNLTSKTNVDVQQSQGANETSFPIKPSRVDSFAIELRDKGLTSSQREANQFRSSRRHCEAGLPFDVAALLQRSFRDDEVDHLVLQMANQLSNRDSQSSNTLQGATASTSSRTHVNTMQRSNICVSCSTPITFEKPGCVALDQVFHVSCFNCKKCGRILAGSSFYNIDSSPTCETCYTESLDKCTKCGNPIADKLLRACGGTFHVDCFICTVCATPLDGVPFTIDSDNNVHCVPCFHEKFAPRCAVCQRGIIPIEGEKESVRVVAMDKSFHVECYRCEDCGLQLSSKIEGQGCYPLDSHLYCKTCNSNRLRVLANV